MPVLSLVHALLWLGLQASPLVAVTTEGLPTEEPGCSTDDFAKDLRLLRPALGWQAVLVPPDDGLQVSLARVRQTYTVRLVAPGMAEPVVRSFEAHRACEIEVQTAALIIERALDELHLGGDAPHIDPLLPPAHPRAVRLAAMVAGGVEQGLLGLTPAVEVEAEARVHLLELTLGVEAVLPESAAFSLPEVAAGTLSATGLVFELAFGVAPRLGPGHLSADAVLGLTLSILSTNSPPLFQQRGATATLPFGGLRVAYALDLPFGTFAGLRAEERLAFGQTAFAVQDGIELGGATDAALENTRVWTFQGTLFLGRRFY